jgi:hypothetical protein
MGIALQRIMGSFKPGNINPVLSIKVMFYTFSKITEPMKNPTFNRVLFFCLYGIFFLLTTPIIAQSVSTLTTITPNSGLWDKEITVTIQGSNFVSGSIVTFTCNSCTKPGISVLSTKYVNDMINPPKIEAIIYVSPEAEIATWQVDVFDPDNTQSTNSLTFNVNERNLDVNTASGDIILDVGSPRRWKNILVTNGKTLTINAITIEIETLTISNGTLKLVRGARLLPSPTINATNATITGDSSYTLDGSNITLTSSNIFGERVTVLGTNLTVGSASRINLNGGGQKGGRGCKDIDYVGSAGQGKGEDGNGAACLNLRPGGGGGYGGTGGNGFSTLGPTDPVSSGGIAYGNPMAPTDLGSGGGKSVVSTLAGNIAVAGGNGGGALKIGVSGTLTNNGIISANGSVGGTGSRGAGGGSGGSVFVSAGTLSGTGTFRAIGGNGGANGGGGGGGGRIVAYYNSTTFPVGNLICTRGTGGSGGGGNGINGTCGGGSGGLQVIGSAPSGISVSPSSLGQGAASKTLVITGNNIKNGATVGFSGSGITIISTTFISSNSSLSVTISVSSFASNGNRILTVTNPDGTSSTTTFSVASGPTVSTISPSRVDQGKSNVSVVISGTNFDSPNGCSLSFSGSGIVINNVTCDSSTQISGNISIAPTATSGQRDVIISNSSNRGRGVGGNRLQVELSPTVNNVSPGNLGQGALSQTLTLTGFSFSSGATVSFSGGGDITSGGVTVNSSTSITVPVTISTTALLGTRDVTVTNLDGRAGTCSGCLTLTQGPSISSISPASRGRGATGQVLSINGSNFVSGATVSFSGAGITINNTSFINSTQQSVTVNIASNATTGTRDVSVTNPDKGRFGGTGIFTINPTPSINTITPKRGDEGATSLQLTISGTDFQNGATVTLGGSGLTVGSTSFVNTGTLQTTVDILPTAPIGARSVTVTNPDGGSQTLSSLFTVDAVPVISSVSPSNGVQGDIDKQVTITGTGFVNGLNVSVGSGITASSINVVSLTQIVLLVNISFPTTPGTYNFTVTNPDGRSSTASSPFTVTAASPLTVNGSQTLTSSDINSYISVTVNNGGVLTLQGAVGLSVQGNMTVAAGGTVTANGKGCPSGQGVGANGCSGNLGIPGRPSGNSGGGHGGNGGNGFFGVGGSSYGLATKPTFLGSGGIAGDNPSNPNGGPGGGAIKLVVGGTLQVDGIISANGNPGGNLNGANGGAGGGAGGSIYLTANTLSGTGSVSANGGAGGTNDLNRGGGGGAGGRIAIYYVPSGLNTFSGVAVPSTSCGASLSKGGTAPPGGTAGSDGTCIITTISNPNVSVATPNTLIQGRTNVSLTLTDTDSNPATNFVNGVTVSFSGTGITVVSTSFVDAQTLSLTVNIANTASSGSRNVTVTNPDGTSFTANGLISISAIPTLTSVSPDNLNRGLTSQTLTLNGSNFQTGATLSMDGGGFSASSCSGSGSQLVCTVSSSITNTAGPRTLTITNPDTGSGSATGLFRINSNPQLTSVSPSSVPPGTLNQVLRLIGSGFISNATVDISCDTNLVPNCSHGIEVSGNPTFVGFNELQVTVNVLSSATVGKRTLVINNQDGGSNTFSNNFEVGAIPSTTVTGLVAYGESSTSTPRFRTWNGSGWSQESSAVNGVNPNHWNVMVSNPVRNEKILASLDSKDRLMVQVWNGVQWGNALEIAPLSGSASVEGTAFDVAFEAGGRGLVVYGLSGSSVLRYRIWDGTNWGSEQQVFNTATTGVPVWVKLAANPSGQEILLVFKDSQKDINSLVWNGTQFGNEKRLTIEGTSPATPGFDVAYERQSGKAMVVWSKNSSSTPRYRIWDGTSWGNEGQAIQLGSSSSANLRHLRLVSDPQSDQMALGILDENRGLQVQFWDGSNWLNTGTRTPFTLTENPGSTLTVSSISPNSIGQGVGSLNLTITGANFKEGSLTQPVLVSFSGTGITVDSANVTVDSPTQLTVPITVSNLAPLGSRNVTVTNTDPEGQSVTMPGLFEVTTGTSALIKTFTQNEGFGRNFDLAWESKKQQMIAAYGNGGILGGVYRKWTLGSGWSSASFLPSGPRIPDVIQLRSNPTNNEQLLTLIDRKFNENDSNESSPQGITFHHWTGFVWDKSTILEANPPSPRTVYDSDSGKNVMVQPESFMVSFAQHQNITGLTVNGINPSILGLGTSTSVTLSGTGLVSGSTVTFSGTGVTTNGGVNASNGGTQLAFTVNVSGGAATGARDITVTNSDGQSVMGVGILTIGSGTTSSPRITGLSPDSAPQGVSSALITINGSGFQTGATVGFSGTGVTVNSVNFVNSSRLDVTVDINGLATPGARDVTVTNPDSGTVTVSSLFNIALVSSSNLLVSSNMTISTDATYPDITVRDGATLTLQGDITLTATGTICVAGTSSTCASGSSGAGGILLIPSSGLVTIKASDMNIESGGQISSDWRGCAAAVGCGSGGIGVGGSSTGSGAGGASHGGRGGNSGNSSGGKGSLSTYGSSTFPITRGSGGGNGDATGVGGAGGGAYKIEVINTLTLNGFLTAQGQNGINSAVSGGGGGSGGSIQVITNILGGSGNFSTKGGNGGNHSSGNNPGGGGGGGRIAVYAITSTLSTSNMNCSGGTGGAGLTTNGQNGGPGGCNLYIQATPTVSSISPSSLFKGVNDQNITILGSNFVDGATVSMGTGVVVNLVKFINAGELVVNVDVNPSAVQGLRDVIVTNPLIGQSPSGNNLLTILDPSDTTAPNAVSDLTEKPNSTTTSSVTFKWTSPADNGGGNVASYDIRYATFQIAAASFSSATSVLNSPTPSSAGSPEEFTIGGLVGGRTYFFALKSKDANGNTSAISNVVSVVVGADTTPPAKITDLRFGETVNSNSVSLIWTSTGDDGSIGQANRYIVKFSITNIQNQTDFNNATTFKQFLIPKTAGSTETLAIGGLSPNTRYYFGVEAVDEAGNKGGFSNIATAATLSNTPSNDTVAPSAITDLVVVSAGVTDTTLMVRWTASGNDGKLGTATGYDLRYSHLEIVGSGGDGVRTINFANATPVSNLPSPHEAGKIETFVITGLTRNTPYTIAIKVFDEGYNQSNSSPQGISGISNIVSSRTAMRNGFNLVSVPLTTIPNDVDSVFGDDVGIPVNISSWFSTGLDSSKGSYQTPTTVQEGMGYILFSQGNLSVVDAPSGSQEITTGPYSISIQRGWNILGNPFNKRVGLGETSIRRMESGETLGFPEAVTRGWVGSSLYLFNGITFDAVKFDDPTPAALEPWQGYWFLVLRDDFSYEMVINKP